MSHLVLRFLHILFMALWVGSALFVTGDVKRSLSDPGMQPNLLRARVRRSIRLGAISGILTLLTGIGLIVSLGGMGSVPVPIHIGLTTTLLMLGVQTIFAMTWSKIDGALEAGQVPASQIALSKRLSMVTGIFHTLWLVTLLLMVFRAVLMG